MSKTSKPSSSADLKSEALKRLKVGQSFSVVTHTLKVNRQTLLNWLLSQFRIQERAVLHYQKEIQKLKTEISKANLERDALRQASLSNVGEVTHLHGNRFDDNHNSKDKGNAWSNWTI